jgi:preprotein translocase subunit SecF
MDISLLRVYFERRKDYIYLLILSFLILSLIGVGYFYTNPVVEQDVSTQTEYEVQTDISFSSEAVRNSTLYKEGESVGYKDYYPTQTFPNLTVEVRSQSDSPEEVKHNISVVTRTVREETIFWNENVSVKSSSRINRDTTVTEASLNLLEINRRHTDIANFLSGRGNIESFIKIEQESPAGTTSTLLEIDVNSVLYGIEDYNNELNDIEQTSNVRNVERLSINYYVSIVLSILFFIILVCYYLFMRYYDIDEEDNWRFDIWRNSDWISRGKLNTDEMNEINYIQLDGVKDTVETAHDTDSRVVYDPDRMIIGVVTGRTCYYTLHPEREWPFQ